ncbi:hypothetical protein OG336_04200 [[Kitasatospora] papulosa]|uniref:vWA domain-containing protein n=1 Tax=[Kitasatospora] papulosa TaxID=1464011 RepID=UPI002E0D5554|nr:hypothetical protein OG336_04200 [[Kitasatospora] papulosa]
MTVSLILNNRPVPRAQLDALPGLPPNFAVVYPLEGGGWEIESPRHRTMTQRWLGKNKVCYVVDLGDHRRTARLTRTPLTCKDQAHRFEATIDVGFRVHDPVAVVRSNLPDVLSAVYPHLISKIRPHAARFAIDEAFEAQARINGSLALPIPLPEGMTLYYCDVQLEPDEAAREFIRGRTEAGRASEMGRLRHNAVIGNTRHQEAVKDIEQESRIARDRRERAALSAVQLDFRGLILEHLAKHPGDTEKSMELLLRWDEARQQRALDQEQRQVEMVRYMIDKGIVREVDVPGLREGVLGPAAGSFGGMLPPGTGAPAAAHALPAAPHPSSPADQASTTGTPPTPPWGGTRPTGTRSSGSSPSAEPSGSPRTAVGLAPVYVVLDTSSTAAGCVTELRDALRSLQTVLANSPDVTSAVRLSVLTFSDTADVRMPLTQVSWQTGVPDLQTGDGCRYEPVFRRLLELVPLETERLKQQATRVNRPTVFFLAVGDPEDGGAWQAAHEELMRHRYRPNIVACGIGTTDRRTVARIASPSEFAVSADARAGLPESVAQFSMLLQNTVLHLGRSAVAGSSELRLERPRGLSTLEDVE